MSAKHFSLDIHEESQIAHLGFDYTHQSLNVLAEEALLELSDILSQLNTQKGLKGLIIYSKKPGQFIAGADIADIEKLASDKDNPQTKVKEGAGRMQAVFQKLSELKCITVCAIHGACLGGGLELALACDYRVLSSDSSTKLGFPEVQLGLLPGAGGTQRTPRIIGIMAALDLITTAKRIPAKKALRIGLAHAVVGEKRLLEVAEIFITSPKKRPSHKKRISLFKRLMIWALEKNPLGRIIITKQAKKAIEKQTKGFYPAPLYALKAVMEGYSLPFNLGLKKEAHYFAKLAMTSQSSSLIHLFHATTHIKKTPYASSFAVESTDTKSEQQSEERASKTTATANTNANKEAEHLEQEGTNQQQTETLNSQTSNTRSITLIGGGFMGASIATLCSARGIRSLLCDPSSQALGRGMKYASQYFHKRLKRRRMKPFEVSQALSRISPSLDSTGFQKTSVAVEAVYEDLNLKQNILKDLEKHASSDWVFASNTSAIPIAKIAENSQRKDRIVGMHFFSPAEKMPLCEVIRTPESSHNALHRVVKLGQSLGKQVIVVKDGPGFYTTRALAFYLAEAIALLEEGAKVESVDNIMTQFGFPVGPFALLDEVGIDVGAHVLDTMIEAFPGRLEKSQNIQTLLDEKRLGRKTAKGIYLYQKPNKASNHAKKTGVDPRIYELFGGPKTQKPPSSSQIRERLSLIFVNESVRCLDDGILDHPYDGDVGAVFGLGFPPFLGGPFHYTDSTGADRVLSSLKNLQAKHGVRFQPAASIEKHAKNHSHFFHHKTPEA